MKFLKHATSFAICRKGLMFLLALTFLSCALATEENSQPARAEFVTKFSFRLINSTIILVKGKFPEFADSLNFILDTGCGGISLDSTTAVQLNLTPAVSDTKITGLSQLTQAKFIYNKVLLLPGLRLDSLDFHINDYEFLREAYGVNVNGIIGYPFLKRFIVKVDYDKQLIEVWRPGKIKYPKNGYAFDARIAGIPLLGANVTDNRPVDGRYFFDTGADLCLLMSSSFVEDSAVLSGKKKIINTEGGGLGGKQSMRFTTVDEMHVGPYVFKKVPAFVFDDKYNVTRYPSLGGIIGNELLRRFNVILNYPENTIHLVPNNSFKEPFNYSYTGFGIYSLNGKVLVQNVVKDPPADKAGLKEDDVVFGVKNDFSNNIESYKEAILRATKTLRVSVLRNNKVSNLVINVESVL